ncbi:MAG: N-carbamoylputrescine amidase [Gammaproteobacteria bacterium]|nr:N-carbamoylputrescine amidase [Gammaproteobacteria bacterium]NIR83489.1 N-carbamoylputrescine amidase [Gammaproteobacteria bacterium]NIR91411.1 N-carbamoylputrescine amidase [Gammaproteobacteria bacterium]NIU04651.1 N-carbamoylputrescine amidase [Gammaproteobacteria bacterium]NIV51693.1 N-carbamoylputrescine amidase [Gammaproteobacteria bacterium]
MATVTLAATQMPCGSNREENLARAEALVREAAAAGAHIVLLQELFETPYFCKDQDPRFFDLAAPAETHPVIERMRGLARELGLVLPVSFFERAHNVHYNALALIDADGAVLGVYRKSHIPDGPGYEEKFYFSPGDTGFRPWRTRYGTLGAAICWDQWFPEAARALVLQGAEILLYPTAIGSEPPDPGYDSRPHWQRVMQGHAAANMVPLVASNRVGTERGESCEITFYGASFIADPTGAIVAEAAAREEAVITASFDLDAVRAQRIGWGVFRDRRPDLYGALLRLDGTEPGSGGQCQP